MFKMNRVFVNLILGVVVVAACALPTLAQRRRGPGGQDQFRFRLDRKSVV